MKTALLLTNSSETQRLLTETIGEKTNFVLLPPPAEPTRESFDTLFTSWLRLADAVILDAASLGEMSRWAIESLAALRLEERQAVVVRITSAQRNLYPIAPNWLVVLDTDTHEPLKQSLGTFFELRDTQAKLKRADAVITRQRQVAPAPVPMQSPAPRVSVAPQASLAPASSSFDSYRYRAALKNISRLLSEHNDEQTLWKEFLGIARELLGVGKLAIFTRSYKTDLFGAESGSAGDQFNAMASAGIQQDVAEHLRLTLHVGIGGFVAREARILRRSQLLDPYALDYDAQIAREFELLGTEVVVPMFDNDQLMGLLTFSGKITGEPIANEELELTYHLMTELAQAIRNAHLREQVADQQRLLSEVLANVQSGVIVLGQDNRIRSINKRARELLELGEAEMTGANIGRLPSRVGDVLFESLQTGREIQQREVILPRSNRPLGVSATRFGMRTKPTSAGGSAGESLIVVGLLEDLTQARLQQARARELADKEFFTRLAARMSHELKNSLVSIKIFAQLLPERYGEKEFREQFGTTVANEVNRVDVLVNNLTFFAHPLDLVREELSLSEMIDGCVKNVAQEFSRKQTAIVASAGEKTPESPAGVPVVAVKKNFAHKLARLEGDRIRLKQAFEHLLRNAVQSMPAGGRLSVNTADSEAADYPGGNLPQGGAVRIEWQDTGEGIALDDLKRVTEPFVTTRNVGVGLGLTIVKKIIERHGGRLEIDSLLGRGTTVMTWLPLIAQPHPDDELIARISRGERVSEQARSEDGVAVKNRVRQRLDTEQDKRT